MKAQLLLLFSLTWGFASAQLNFLSMACAPPPNPAHGTVQLNAGGMFATYLCDEHYLPSRYERVRMCMFGTWFPVEPIVCEPTIYAPPTSPTASPPAPTTTTQIQCAPPPAIISGTYSPINANYNPADVVTYSCSQGYALVGVSMTTCQGDGTWSQAAPTCAPVCSSPPLPANGTFNNSGPFFYGTTGHYACNPNTTLDGNTTNTCQNGQWTKTPPLCRAITNSFTCAGVGYVLYSDPLSWGRAYYMCQGQGHYLHVPYDATVNACVDSALNDPSLMLWVGSVKLPNYQLDVCNQQIQNMTMVTGGPCMSMQGSTVTGIACATPQQFLCKSAC